MIVNLSNDVCKYINDIDRLDKIKNSMLAVKSTYETLKIIIKDINRLAVSTAVIGRKLPISVQESIHREYESVFLTIMSSRNSFDHDFRQADVLSSGENVLQETMKNIENQWQDHANEWAREPLQLLNLVKYLSEVKAHAEVYEALKTKIQHFINNVPESLEQLTIFEQNVQKLNELLNAIELDIDIREFLQKVIDGQATMQDITAEIRAWCQSGDREHDFLITIAG